MNGRRLAIHAAPALAAGGALAAVPFLLGGSPYGLRIVSLMLILAIYAVAFNLLFGHTRQLFLCVGALAGLGAYASVILVRDMRLSPLLATVLATLGTALLGGFLSYVGVRRGLGVLFVGIITVAVSLIFQNLLLGLREYTNGETGISTRGLGFGLGEAPQRAYYVLLGVLVGALSIYQLLLRSRHGLAFRALEDDELNAELSGIDVTRYKVGTATLASALIGLTGALYADVNGFISPSVFALGHVDIPVLIVLLLGGMRTVLGPVVGAGVFTVVDELVRPFGQLTVLTYGILLMVLFLIFREGVVPLAAQLFLRLGRTLPAGLPPEAEREPEGGVGRSKSAPGG
ncbi:MAG: branched-chain amino acid ABC transporter permease [Armatimonadota bacterium]|nr:branched-chain amino acid ABC transporter permease [Armatimonadota bacterium]MDR7439508.1 branched-chain amino acid ABC transporter permease [Armatimonadota bacterium]MDR7563115.1 branched-chain amino acid ABC transporter permease [Armatimonadota bacterium]MDR7568416.1 branched-chain amino acid ABC transporter permease [Armatimonadota bacterium]MDR7600968.1 branched-chain amino acid ABC transporter permease [Armatimonadota bacterium]